MKTFNKLSVATFAILFALIVIVIAGQIATRATATAPALGNVASFAVLGATTVTNTGDTVLHGDLGLSPDTSITGFPPGTYTGTLHKTDETASLAQTATTNAYNAMSAQSFDVDLTGQNLGGLTLTPGVYKFTSSAQLTGKLTLNAQDDPNAVWIFQIGTTLTTANSSSVVFSNPGVGTPGCNVFWQVGTAATLGKSTAFVGTIIAHTEAITLNTSATLYGRALSSIAAVTLDTNTITVPVCVVTPVAPTLKLIKDVTNDNGGTTLSTAWTLYAAGDAKGFNDNGSTGIFHTITAGVGYALSESTVAGYTPGSWSCDGESLVGSTITLSAGQNVTCTINNNDIAPVLHVIKHVINDDGGIHPNAGDFTINVTGTNVSDTSFTGEEDPGTTITLNAGTYTINESAVAGYTKTLGANCSGTIAVGGVKSCTITNNDNPLGVLPGSIAVVKHVVGGTKVPADFDLFVNDSQVDSGAVNDFLPGAYIVTEDTDSNYDQTFSSDCGVNGHLTLAASEDKVCIITNTYVAPSGPPAYIPPTVPPLIDVVKVPSPLSLPNGPGSVNYTYTLRNIGTVPVTNLTMVGDTCGPITLTSGDTNGDNKLDLSETWIYNCSTNISVTHTNIVTTTGWANGISATDIASATVVVGLPIVPPLIHITKVPNPLTLGTGGGMVTYTKKIINPGTVALSNVHVTDDKCSPIHYVSGDINKDYKLDTTETWTYTCQSNLTKTTTNTATATGEANGLTARDFAIATVIVGLPIVPPLIHITKIPNPLTLPAKGGMVTYTKKITNPGTVPLSNVHIADDKCSPIHYVSGDINKDYKLDTTETWTYTCRSNLTRTTTNTATATGEANGLTARDFAIATVIVAAPGLPSTGLPPAPWNIVIIAETLILILILLIVTIKKRKA